MGSRGYQRQWRKALAQVRVARKAYCASVIVEVVREVERQAVDPRFAGLDGLMGRGTPRPAPFGDPSDPIGAYTGTVGGLARVHRDLRAEGFIIVPNSLERRLFS